MPGLLTSDPPYSNRLIDNAPGSPSLSEVLRECLRDERFTTLHIATGYWDLPGMTLLVSELEGFLQREGTRIELLIGKDPYVYASMVQKPKYKDAAYPTDFLRTDLTDLAVTEQHVRALALLLTHCPDERINVHLYRGTDPEGHEPPHGERPALGGRALGHPLGELGVDRLHRRQGHLGQTLRRPVQDGQTQAPPHRLRPVLAE